MRNYLKFLTITLFVGLLSSCSSDDGGASTLNYTVYKNQSDDLAADALQLHYTASDNSHTINFYGAFDGNKNPTTTNTITYKEANSNTIVNLIIDPTTRRISSLFTTVNGVNSNVVMKFDYPNDTELKVSFYEYDWATNTSGNIFLTKLIKTTAANKKPLYVPNDGLFDFAYNISALAIGVAAAESVAAYVGGWSGISALSGAAAALAASVSTVALVGTAAIVAVAFFLSEASAATIPISDLIPPANIPLQNPVLPANNPTTHLQQSPCFNSDISFEASMDGSGTILIFSESGGVYPYTFMVGNVIQANPSFPNQYPDGSYIVGVKDANGCMSVKLVTLDRAVDTIFGTWKLNSLVDGNTQQEIGQTCDYSQTMTLNANGSMSGKRFELNSNNVCELYLQYNGTYINNNNQTIDFSITGSSPASAQILILTDTTLRLKFVDGQDILIETYTRQ